LPGDYTIIHARTHKTKCAQPTKQVPTVFQIPVNRKSRTNLSKAELDHFSFGVQQENKNSGSSVTIRGHHRHDKGQRALPTIRCPSDAVAVVLLDLEQTNAGSGVSIVQYFEV
jgi:hypothetical protein